MTKLEIELGNAHSEYEPARDRLLEFFRDAGVAENTVGEIELVIEELLVNVISYAYPEEGTGRIYVSAGVDGGEVTLEIRDDGVPFNPLERESPDLDEPFEERPVGGLGIFLVTELATSVSYRREDGKNVLTLTRSG